MHALLSVAVDKPIMNGNDKNENEGGKGEKEEMSAPSFFNIPHVKLGISWLD